MRRCMLFVLCLLVGIPALSAAQGFGIYEQGTCAMGRAGTGVAAPCQDGSAMFFNPAGLAGLTGGHATIGTTLLDVQGAFTEDLFPQQKSSLDDPLIAVPQVYISYGRTSKLAFGVGVFAPYGLETKWPLSFDGRFAGYKNILQSLYIQPTVAYQISSKLSLGGGFDIVRGKVELNQQLDLANAPVPLPGLPQGTTFSLFGIAPGTEFVDAHLEATKTTVGGHFGAIFKASDRLSFGARFLTQAKFDYSGTATFTQVPTGIIVPDTLTVGPVTIPKGCPIDNLLAAPAAACGGVGFNLFDATAGVFRAQPVTTTIKNPSQLGLGLAFKADSAWTLLADYQYTWWSEFNELDITFPQDASGLLSRKLSENYKNTSGVRLGVEWAKSARWTWRGGFLHHGGAAPAETVTPLLPEGQRNEVTIGTTVKLSKALSADLAYQYIRQNDRRGRTREPNINQTASSLNDGLYTFHAHLFGVSLGYAF